MIRIAVVISLLALSITQPSCMVDADQADEPNIGQTSAALTQPPLIVDWHAGQPDRVLADAIRFVCVLGGLGGHFEGNSEHVRVRTSGGNWILDGNSSRSDTRARAICYRRSEFIASGDPRWLLSDSISARSTSRSLPLFPSAFNCGDVTQSTLGGAGAIYISGIGGKLEKKELVSVYQSSSASHSSSVRAKNCVRYGKRTHADVMTFFPGFVSTTSVVRFSNGFGTGRANQVPEIQLYSDSGVRTRVLPAVEDAMCYFTMIEGGFDSSSHFAELETVRLSGRDYWRLRVSGTSGNRVRVRVRCLAINQGA